MSTDLDQELERAYPTSAVRIPAAGKLWELGREQRRRRTAAGIVGTTALAAGLVVVAAISPLSLPTRELPGPVISGGEHEEGHAGEPDAGSVTDEPSLAERHGIDERWTDEMIRILPEFDIDPRTLAEPAPPHAYDDIFEMVSNELERRAWEPTRPAPIDLEQLVETREQDGMDMPWYAVWGADSPEEHLGDDLEPFCDWLAEQVEDHDLSDGRDVARMVGDILSVELGQVGDGLGYPLAEGCGLQEPRPEQPTDALREGLDPTAHGWEPSPPPIDLDPLNVDEIPQWYRDEGSEVGVVGLEGVADRLGSMSDAEELCDYLREQQAAADAAVDGRAVPLLVVSEVRQFGAENAGDGLTTTLGLACDL